MNDSFWQDQNAWWISAMSRGLQTEADWDEANCRLWCLSRLGALGKVSVHDRADLIQTVLLRLQKPGFRKRLSELTRLRITSMR